MASAQELPPVGKLLQVGQGQLLQLPPLHTVLRGGKRSGTKSVPVTLAARCTEIGTLELWCVARDSANRWRLEFNDGKVDQALDFSLEEVREARLVPVVDFKGRRGRQAADVGTAASTADGLVDGGHKE